MILVAIPLTAHQILVMTHLTPHQIPETIHLILPLTPLQILVLTPQLLRHLLLIHKARFLLTSLPAQ